MAMVMPRPGLTTEMVNALTPEQKEKLKQDIQNRNLENARKQGEKDGLAGSPMNKGIIEDTGRGPFSTKVAQAYAEGYVKGRETRGRGRGKKRGKKSVRKTRRVKKLNGRK